MKSDLKQLLRFTTILYSFVLHSGEPNNDHHTTWQESETICKDPRQQLKDLMLRRAIVSITNDVVDRSMREAIGNFVKTAPNHLQNLYDDYKKLEDVYALNVFYSGTQYECKPEQRSAQIILKNLSNWNGFIRSRLKDKNDFNAEEVEMVQTLQLHQKEAQVLTDLCIKYNQWRHDHYQERKDFVKYAVQAITLTSDVRALELFRRDTVKNQFDRELEKIQIKENVEYVAFKNAFTREWLDQIPLEPCAIILDNFPDLTEYEKENIIKNESIERANLLRKQNKSFKLIKKTLHAGSKVK